MQLKIGVNLGAMLRIAQEDNEVTNMDLKDLKWYVYYHDFNGKKIKPFNIFNHGRFREDVEKNLKKCETKEEFAEKLRRDLFYYFGSKCEWEIVLTSWAPRILMSELDRLNAEREKTIKEGHREPYSLAIRPDVGEKIDVRDQVINNLDIFIDYIWSHKPTKRKSRNKLGGKCYMAKNYCRHSSNGYCVADDETASKCPYLNAVGEIAELVAPNDIVEVNYDN